MIFLTDTQAQTPVSSFGFIIYNDFSFHSVLPAHLPDNWKWLENSRKMGVGGKQGKKRILTCCFKYFPDLRFQDEGRKRKDSFF